MLPLVVIHLIGLTITFLALITTMWFRGRMMRDIWLKWLPFFAVVIGIVVGTVQIRWNTQLFDTSPMLLSQILLALSCWPMMIYSWTNTTASSNSSEVRRYQ